MCSGKYSLNTTLEHMNAQTPIHLLESNFSVTSVGTTNHGQTSVDSIMDEIMCVWLVNLFTESCSVIFQVHYTCVKEPD